MSENGLGSPTPQPSAEQPASRGSWLLLLELVAIGGLALADAAGVVPLSRTPFLLLICWVSLRYRRQRWRDIGLALPPRAARAVATGVAAGLALEVLAIVVTTPLIASITGRLPDHSDLQELVGNLPLLVLLIVVSWILAAFGEEIAFRGYLMTRLAEAFGGTSAAWIASLLVASLYFGIGHATQGVTGIVQESFSGLLLGVLFLVTGRNLTVPIVAHGVSNTLALVLIYLNRYPGLPG